MMENDFFAPDQPGLFDPLLDSIYRGDFFMVCADFEAYLKTQDVISNTYQDHDIWTRMSIRNVARAGFFSSDRTIKEYAKDIWHV